MRKSITAFTTPEVNYPAYISVNLHNDNSVEEIEIIMREAAQSDGECGRTIAIRMPKAEFAWFLVEGIKNL